MGGVVLAMSGPELAAYGEAVDRLLAAQERLLNDWAEVPTSDRLELWVELHNAADAVRSIYDAVVEQ